MRHLVVVLGDQLNADSLAFDDFDPSQDCVWMAERVGESRYVWSSKVRSAVFLSAMRHFAASLPDEETGMVSTPLNPDATQSGSRHISHLMTSLVPALLRLAMGKPWQPILQRHFAHARAP